MSMNLIPSSVPNAGSGLDPVANALDAPYAVVPVAVAGALPVAPGTYPLTAAAAIALTLAVPVAGLPSQGGNDGQELTYNDTGGHAHTITCPTSGNIVPAHHILTFNGTAGSFVTLVAYNGVYYVEASSGVTPT